MSMVPDMDHLKGTTRSRIPSKLPMRQKQVPFKPKPHCETQVMLRPKSVNRVKDESPGRINNNTRPMRIDRDRPTIKKPQKFGIYQYNELPDQETIQVRENLETTPSRVLEVIHTSKATNHGWEEEKQTKGMWQKYTKEFELMKKDLDERQRAIVELYANMRNTHQKMMQMGQTVTMPPSEDLTIMNVAKLSPDQLLELCAVRPVEGNSKSTKDQKQFAKSPLTIEISKLYDLPTKIVATCEQTLTKRKEIIDWVIELKSKEKGISRHTLESKMHEFYAENEMLSNSLELAKGDFRKNLEEIMEFIRKTMNDAIACQLRAEEHLCMMSKINSENSDLRKQLHNNEHVKSQNHRIEELEAQLKEEKRTKATMRDQLARAGGQIKIGEERAAQLETALEQAKSETADLDQIIIQLQKQCLQMQDNFDKELSKLTDSVQVNMRHLEEIADARVKLQAEKEDLEKRLEDLSQFYNESLKSVKHDMNVNIAKLIETEKKFDDAVEAKKDLLMKVESLQTQKMECEMRNNNLEIILREKEMQLGKIAKYENELQSTKQELYEANKDLEESKRQLAEQSEAIKLLESDLEDSLRSDDKLKSNILTKDRYISQLEAKQAQLEEQLQDSENKMSSYEVQLSCLKDHITQLQEDFGEFDNLEELHDMVNQQRANLLETTRQNGELAQALQKKDEELDSHLERLAEQGHIIEQKDSYIKLLTDKEEEQTNIIKLLRTNLEMRTQADVDLSRQITEKNSEIQALIANVETRKQQISELETIILTLEEQSHKSIVQRRKKDQDRISSLEKQIAEYETCQLDNKHELPDKNLDSIIKILEEELRTPFEPQIISRSHDYMALPKKAYVGERRREYQHFECHERNNKMTYQTENESFPTKMVFNNVVQKTCITKNNDLDHFKVDNLDRKKAIMNIDTQKWATDPDPGTDTYVDSPPAKDKTYTPFRGALFTATHPLLARNLQILNTNQFRNEKKCKMFKLACHKL